MKWRPPIYKEVANDVREFWRTKKAEIHDYNCTCEDCRHRDNQATYHPITCDCELCQILNGMINGIETYIGILTKSIKEQVYGKDIFGHHTGFTAPNLGGKVLEHGESNRGAIPSQISPPTEHDWGTLRLAATQPTEAEKRKQRR